jgi:hypothetical protein
MPASDQARHNGSCFCGAVEVETTGEPFAMGYCHCSDCRAWAAAPVNGFALWKLEAVKIKRGEKSLAAYRRTERSHRRYCTKCGGHVMTAHPNEGFMDVYAAILPTLTFKPTNARPLWRDRPSDQRPPTQIQTSSQRVRWFGRGSSRIERNPLYMNTAQHLEPVPREAGFRSC